MTTILEDAEVFDHENDERAPFDEYSIFEMEQDRKLKVISNFKNTISKEPEFCGIFSLTSYNILRMFDDSSCVILKNRKLTSDQHSIIKECYYTLNNKYPEDNYIDQIGFNIIDTIYV